MSVCINKNSVQYQSLKDKAGIPEFILESVCRDFLEKYDRFPYLDEILGSNSEPYLKKRLGITSHKGAKIEDILNVTGKSTIEEAVVDINNEYRDLETTIVPIVNEAIVDIVHRPTENNFDNWTEEDEILSKSPRNNDGNLLAPNGRISNLNEKQYAQVRTKAFKNWFGDWINNPGEASKVVDENGEPLVVYHASLSEDITTFDNKQTEEISKATEWIYNKNLEDWEKDYIITNEQKREYNEGKTITIYKPNALYFASNKDVADTYRTLENWENGLHKVGKTYEVFLNIRNTPIIEGNKATWNTINHNNKIISTRDLEELYRNTKDGVIVKNIYDFGSLTMFKDKSNLSNVYIVYNPNQIKSATSNSGLFSRANDDIYDPAPNGFLVLNNALHKLASLHGINFNEINSSELASDKWKGVIPDGQLINAFIYNGQIYINTDRSSIDAPIHEMFHMFVGSLRFTNPNLYQELVESIQYLPDYGKLIAEYPGRTRNDVNEEILVTQVSRYLTGQESSLSKLDDKARYEITYNIKRMLDTILMGQDSVKTISEQKLFRLSLKEIAKEVNSTVMKNNFKGFMNVEGSELHRRLNNVKADLFKEGTLIEQCD